MVLGVNEVFCEIRNVMIAVSRECVIRADRFQEKRTTPGKISQNSPELLLQYLPGLTTVMEKSGI